MNEDYKPRFVFEISDEQKQRADKLLATHGIRKAIFCRILDDVLDLVEERGGMALGILISDAVRPKKIIPRMSKAEEV